MKKENLILDKTVEFALDATKLNKVLLSQNEYVFSRQMIKSASSIGANVQEAIAAQSRNDFISKMTIASKESREAKYWLTLIEKGQLTVFNCQELLNQSEELIRILTKIVKTSQSK